MKRNRFPSNLILSNIVIHTAKPAHTHQVEEIAKVELVEHPVASGIVHVDNRLISWSLLSHSRGNPR